MVSLNRMALSGHASRYAGIVFDCDGLLADTTDHWNSAFTRVAGVFGGAVSTADVAALQGSNVSLAAARIAELIGVHASRASIATELHALLVNGIAAHPPHAMPGAYQFVDHVRRHLPVGVASNAPADVLAEALDAIAMTDFFQAVITPDSRVCPKPE